MYINIKDAYNLEFCCENIKYSIELTEFIDYLTDYYTSDMIENSDGLCDLVESFANSYDMIEVLRLCDNLTEDMLESEYFVIDCVYYYITPVNDFYDLSEVYDFGEVIEDLCNDSDNLKYYCNKL